MKNYKIDNLLKWICLVISIIALISTACMFLFCFIEFNIYTIIGTIIFLLIFVFFYILALLKHRGYMLRYCFSKKKYNQEIQQSLMKFPDAPNDFIKQFKERTLSRYRYACFLFSRDSNDNLYKDKKSKGRILDLYSRLYNSILSKGGFIQFFTSIEDTQLDAWEINNYLCNDLISNELDYLLSVVYELTQFSIYDNRLSQEFTKRNNQLIEDLNNIYSPLLFNFKEEIETILTKLKD